MPAGNTPPPRRAGEPFDLGDLLTQPRADCEAAIRERCMAATLGNGGALCRVLGRYRMFVETGDIDDSAAFLLDGFRDLPVTAAMLGCVRRGSTAIDVGAGLGYHALALGELVGTGGKVIAFEPHPVLAKRARDSVGVNGFAASTAVHEYALGAEETAGMLAWEPHCPGRARLRERDGEGMFRGVPVRRLDSFPEALNAEFVRIDASGHEQQIWRGMTGLLARGGPLTIFLAFHAGRYADPAGFLGEIAGEGFLSESLHDLEGGGKMLCLRR